MKKTGLNVKKVLVAGVLTMTVGLTACSQASSESKDTSSSEKDGDVLKVTLLGGGYGDKSFNDSAKEGVEALEEKYPGKVEVNVVDMTVDTKKWQAAMYEAGDSDADIIITGGFQQTDNLQEIAPQYPDKKWIAYDLSPDYDSYDLENVYSVGYKSNEAGYLAGMVAGYMTESGAEKTNADKVVGFVGGMSNTPTVNNYLVGYIQGAQAVDPEIKVATSYVNSFEDSAKAKEIALSQVNSDKADVVFAAAGAAGTGCVEAAFDTNTWFIGVDSDQSLEYEGKKEQEAIITSAMKRVDQSLINAIGRALDGTLPYGEYEELGLEDDCVGIVENDTYDVAMSEEGKEAVKQAQENIKNGKIELKSSYDLTNDEINEMINNVKP